MSTGETLDILLQHRITDGAHKRTDDLTASDLVVIESARHQLSLDTNTVSTLNLGGVSGTAYSRYLKFSSDKTARLIFSTIAAGTSSGLSSYSWDIPPNGGVRGLLANPTDVVRVMNLSTLSTANIRLDVFAVSGI